MFTISYNNKTLDLKTPVIMGILNATPNSFYNKGQESDADSLLRVADKMLNDGATILDIGGASTKPGELLIDASAELQRVIPVVTAIRQRFPEAWLSVDTYNATVARATLEAGVDIVNDISAGTFDKNMLKTVAVYNAPFIAMHIQGTPENMQIAPHYADVVAEVRVELQEALARCKAEGIVQVIIDPGFGFGKTVAHNYALLRSLADFGSLGCPILAGISRKSLICKPLKINPEHALNGTTALNMAALMNGANILRVHDVKEAAEVVRLFGLLNGN